MGAVGFYIYACLCVTSNAIDGMWNLSNVHGEIYSTKRITYKGGGGGSGGWEWEEGRSGEGEVQKCVVQTAVVTFFIYAMTIYLKYFFTSLSM